MTKWDFQNATMDYNFSYVVRDERFLIHCVGSIHEPNDVKLNYCKRIYFRLNSALSTLIECH